MSALLLSPLKFMISGMTIGVAVAAPPGPLSILTLRTAVEQGLKAACMVMLGSGVAHLLFASIAVSGLGWVAQVVGLKSSVTLKSCSAALLIYLAIKELARARSGNQTTQARLGSKNIWEIPLLTFALTLTNPMTILSFLSMFATLQNQPSHWVEYIALILGVCSGSLLWRMGLVSVSLAYREAILEKYLLPFRLMAALSLTYFAGCALFA